MKSKHKILLFAAIVVLVVLAVAAAFYARAYAAHDRKAKAEQGRYFTSLGECNARSQQNEEDGNNGRPLSYPGLGACYDVPVSIGHGHWYFPVFIENGEPQTN